MNSECRSRLYYPALLSLLLAAVFALGGCTNAEKAKAEHLSKGDVFLKDGKFQEASIEYRNALQIDDSLAPAHWGLARAYEGLQRFQEAFEEMRRTVELDPNNLDARIKLGNYYLAVGKGRTDLIAEAERLAKEVLAKEPNNIEGHILLGSVLFAKGQKDEALAEIDKAISIDPKRVESYLSLARFYQVTNEPVKAEEIFKKAIEVNASSSLAHSEYGKFLSQMNRLPEAEAELQKAVEVDPSNRNARFVLASFYLVNKQPEKAEEAYKALANLDPSKPEGTAMLADFYASVNRLDESINIYRDLAAKFPEYTQSRYRLAEIMLMKGDTTGAVAQIDEVLKKDAHDRQALMLRARVRMAGGSADDLKAAIEDLKEVLRQEPDSRPGLYFMAQANYNLGLIDQARAFAGDLERRYPDYLPAKLMQAQIALITGDAKGAVAQSTDLLERLNKTGPDRENSPQMLTELKMKALITRGNAYGALRNLNAARQDFTAARDASPGTPDVYIQLANLARAENKSADALGFFEQALAIDKTNVTALTGLIDVYAKEQDLGKAYARLDQLLASNPNSAPLHFLKAQVYGIERNVQGAEAELRKTLELDPNYLPAYSALGALFVNTRQEERAIDEYRKIIEKRPDNSTAYTLIGMLEESRKNYAAAAENYRKAIEKDPNAVIAANNLAWAYAVHRELNGNLDEAVRLAQGVVQKNPNVASFIDTLGWIYYHKGLHAAAVEQLQKAVTIDESSAKSTNRSPSPNYRYHLGMALKAKGDRPAAKKELQLALQLGEKAGFADAEEARKALAEL